MSKNYQEIAQKATEALGKNLVAHTLPQKERFEIQTAFVEAITALEELASEVDKIPELCPCGCEPGDMCPSVCPNYNEGDDEYHE